MFLDHIVVFCVLKLTYLTTMLCFGAKLKIVFGHNIAFIVCTSELFLDTM